jgi:uncharacterized membrane protein
MSGDEALEIKGGLQRRLERHSHDRLIILSDGVFAIAITLAAFEIKVPDGWRDLADLWGQLRLPVLVYVLSFALVASYWNSQRTLFARLVRVDTPLMVLAMLQLLFVALIPVATRAFYDHAKQADVRAIYYVTLAICGYLTAAAWGYAALRPVLVHADSKAKDCWTKFFGELFAPLILTWFAVTGDTSAKSATAAGLLLAGRFVLRLRHVSQ